MERLIFCNIGWMTHYKGLQDGETIASGGKYVKENGTGFEVCNFSGENARQLGFVRSRTGTIAIERLGAEADSDRVEGVAVVWTALRPGGGTFIVGWYKDATVYRKEQSVPARGYPMHCANNIESFNIEAARSGIVLLDVDARSLEVPKARDQDGGMGQSNLWYADAPGVKPFLQKVRQLLSSGGQKVARKGGLRCTPDAAHNALVEAAACAHVWTHFEELGYKLKSVEKDNRGWDLEAVSGRITLHIEVKGLSGSRRTVEVTPNEYRAFKAVSSDYRLAVVSSALTKPRLTLVHHDPTARTWVVDGDASESVHVETVEAARITIA